MYAKWVKGEVSKGFTQPGCPAKTFLEKGTKFHLHSDLGTQRGSPDLIHFDHCLDQPPPP